MVFSKTSGWPVGGAAMAAGFQWPALPAARPLPRWTIVSATAAVGHRVRFLPESAPGPGWVLRRRCPSCFVPADPDCGGTPCCSYVCSVRQRPSPRHWVAGAPPWRRAGARSTRTTVRASWWAWALHDGSVRVAWKAVCLVVLQSVAVLAQAAGPESPTASVRAVPQCVRPSPCS